MHTVLREIINIGRTSHNMYSNNIVNNIVFIYTDRQRQRERVTLSEITVFMPKMTTSRVSA